ncbi:MAG: AraC family transcriptional regulator, partial [Tannerella sp.]|nr:AraC family transcriptional regulator [Tannerella sp.]
MKPLYQELSFLPANYVNVYKEELPHFIVPWHYHPEIEIMYILEGTGIRFVGDSVEAYEVGDLCMVGSNLPHEWRNDRAFFEKKPSLRASCYCLFLLKELFGATLLETSEMQHIKSLIERSNRGIKFTGKARREIGLKISDYAKESGAAKIAKLILLLEQMAVTTEYELLASVGYTKHHLNTEDFERFNKVHRYIMKNFTHPIRLEEAASFAGLTPNAFCRYFRERTKMTFVSYLNEIRIGHA